MRFPLSMRRFTPPLSRSIKPIIGGKIRVKAAVYKAVAEASKGGCSFHPSQPRQMAIARSI